VVAKEKTHDNLKETQRQPGEKIGGVTTPCPTGERVIPPLIQQDDRSAKL
jgi:hypothetical protein